MTYLLAHVQVAEPQAYFPQASPLTARTGWKNKTSRRSRRGRKVFIGAIMILACEGLSLRYLLLSSRIEIFYLKGDIDKKEKRRNTANIICLYIA